MTKMEKSHSTIAIFDSGVGGLSIYAELKKLLPREKIVYLADQKNCPYGEKAQDEVRLLTLKSLTFLTSFKPKLIVVACNTATVAGIDFYRKKFPQIPIVGVVPVVKTAAEMTKNGRIAILSTPSTSKSKYQKELIEKHGNTKMIWNIACPNLVSHIERGIVSGKKIEEELIQILKPVINNRCDTIVLGCTHYPFLKKTIIKILNSKSEARNPKQIQMAKIQNPKHFENLNLKNLKIVSNFDIRVSDFLILDSGPAVARQVERILKTNNLLELSPPSKNSDLFFTTGDKKKFSIAASKLLKSYDI